MSYASALNRLSEIRSVASATPASAGNGAGFAQALATATNGAQGSAAAASLAGASSLDGATGLPLLSAADQYRMLGITPPMASGFAPEVAASGGPVGQRMVAAAQRELGVHEDLGTNEGQRISEYRTATTGASNTPGPWCAYFVSWVAQQAGAPVGPGGSGTGYVPTLESWGKQQGRFVEHGAATPAPGDIVIFNWGSSGVADHTGIVESVDTDGTVRTIEGNSSDRVQRRSYGASTNDIAGYIKV